MLPTKFLKFRGEERVLHVIVAYQVFLKETSSDLEEI